MYLLEEKTKVFTGLQWEECDQLHCTTIKWTQLSFALGEIMDKM